MSQTWRTLSVVSALSLAMAGCGSGPKVAPVEGTVLLEGEPLVGASVNTQPIGSAANPKPGAGSFGKTDDQGHYSLKMVDPLITGAVLGEHRVTITRGSTEPYRDSDKIVKPQGSPWPMR